MASSKRGFLEPKVGDPSIKRKHQNGQAINPPSYMDFGGMTGPSKLGGDTGPMRLEKGGPKARQGKPI